VEPTSVGGIPASRPEITGTAYLTGFHQFVLDGGDPLATGFLVG
jgi:proline racemase